MNAAEEEDRKMPLHILTTEGTCRPRKGLVLLWFATHVALGTSCLDESPDEITVSALVVVAPDGVVLFVKTYYSGDK